MIYSKSTNNVNDILVVLINLDRSVARRQMMETQLQALGLKYERLAAVDGKARWADISNTVDTKKFQKNMGRDVLPGEIGCYHSHLQAWKVQSEKDCELMLVLEDDVIFGPNFIDALQVAVSIKNEWDILKLNKIRANQPVCQLRVDGYKMNAYLGVFTGLGAYLINRQVARRLLPKMLPITRPIDHELDRIDRHDLRHFGLEPFPSKVEDYGDSTINGLKFSEVKKYHFLRRLPVYLDRVGYFFRRLMYLRKKQRLSLFK